MTFNLYSLRAGVPHYQYGLTLEQVMGEVAAALTSGHEITGIIDSSLED